MREHDILPSLERRALDFSFGVRSSPRRVLSKTFQVLTLLRPTPAPYSGEFLAHAGGGIMYGDAALPRNDWCNSAPIGHALGCYKISYKHHDSFPSLKERDFSQTKLNRYVVKRKVIYRCLLALSGD